MRMMRLVLSAVAVAMPLSMLSACASNQSASAPATPPTASAAWTDDTYASNDPGYDDPGKVRAHVNPVTVLKKVKGCKIPAGVTVGDQDIVGEWFASCGLATNAIDDITVTSMSGAYDPITDGAPTDSTRIILGKGWMMTVGGAPYEFTDGTYNLNAIAKQVGGTVYTGAN